MHPTAKVIAVSVYTAIAAITIEVTAALVAPQLDNPHILRIASVVLILPLGVAVWLYWRWHRKQLRLEFNLFIAAEDLTPKEVGLTEARIGVDTGSCRPYFPTAYISRVAVAYDEPYRPGSTSVYDEAAMISALQRGERLLLIGPVLEGKTRTLLEIVRQMRGFIVVRPRSDRAPGDDALDLLRGKKVLCLLDDLISSIGASVDLLHVYRSIDSIASKCALAAAYPYDPGPEEQELTRTPAQRIFHALTLRLKLRPASAQEKARLKEMLGTATDGEFPTLGSICMGKPLELVRSTFPKLKRAEQDCLEAMQLLATGGINPMSRRRLRAVVAHVFKRRMGDASVRDCLADLERYGFITSPANSDPIIPELAYVVGPHAAYYYSSGRHCVEDLPHLAEVLLNLEDAEGLNLLAMSRYRASDLKGALEYWDQVLTHFDGHAGGALEEQIQRARYDRGMTRGLDGNRQGEIADYTALINRPDVASDWVVLARLARAMAWDVCGDHSVARAESSRAEEEFRFAIDDYNAIEELQRSSSSLLARVRNNRGDTWGKLGEFAKEIADHTKVTQMLDAPSDEVARAYLNRGDTKRKLALTMQGPEREALLQSAVDDFDVVIERMSQSVSIGPAHLNRAEVLKEIRELASPSLTGDPRF